MDKKLKILIIGSGGREHAVGWKVAQSPRVGQIFFAPGNAGTAQIGTNIPIDAKDIKALLEFAKKPARNAYGIAVAGGEKIDLTLALPDDPLALGIVNEFEKESLRIWGPTKEASKLEWSKAFSKEFMRRHNLPTAKFEIFSDFEKAKEYIARQSFPVVIKASGLALGKGVIICQTLAQAYEILENMLVKKTFGDSGSEVVIEEFLTGPEISIHVFSDGINYSVSPASQDHKKIGEGDIGLNTGGMGTVAPLPFVNKEMMDRIEQEIIFPTLKGMIEEGKPFKGVLYPGLILTEEGPKILEYNARFGDPETQTYMRLLDTDIMDIFDACIEGTLSNLKIKWNNISACTVIIASSGYPESYEKGKVISGINKAPARNAFSIADAGGELDSGIVIFHAGTKILENKFVTNGGRVLGVSATGNTLKEALDRSYNAISKISFEGMQYRKDIGEKSLEIKNGLVSNKSNEKWS